MRSYHTLMYKVYKVSTSTSAAASAGTKLNPENRSAEGPAIVAFDDRTVRAHRSSPYSTSSLSCPPTPIICTAHVGSDVTPCRALPWSLILSICYRFPECYCKKKRSYRRGVKPRSVTRWGVQGYEIVEYSLKKRK